MPRRWLVGIVLFAASTAPAPAQNYKFSKIADDVDGGPFSSFGTVFSINGSGNVTFLAYLNEPHGVNGVNGIYVGSAAGGPLSTVADPSTPGFACFCDGPTINAAGTVAFGARITNGGQGVYVGTTAQPNTPITVADTTSVPTPMPAATFDEFGSPAINNTGQVAFQANLTTSGQQGVYAGTTAGGTIHTVADNYSSVRFGTFGDPTINGSGQVAFFATLAGGGEGVYVGTTAGGTIHTVADTSSGTLSAFGDPAINNAGQVAFTATATATGVKGVYIGSVNDGTLAAIATSGTMTGVYSAFGNPAINNSGQVAFTAALVGGGEGIFTGSNPLADYVIRKSDALDGSTVDSLDLSSFSLADDGRIVFSATLANGLTGLFVATPVPEPGFLLGIAAAGLAAARRLRRR